MRGKTLPYYKTNLANNVIECPLCPSDSGGTAIWLLNIEEHLKTTHPQWSKETPEKLGKVKVVLSDAKKLRGKAAKALQKDQKTKKRKFSKRKQKGPKQKKPKPEDDWLPGAR